MATIYETITHIGRNDPNVSLRQHQDEYRQVDTRKDKRQFKKWYDKAWDLVPMDKEADIQLDHDYDGIKELDNRLPPWWLYLFYITIVIGIGYLYVYHFYK